MAKHVLDDEQQNDDTATTGTTVSADAGAAGPDHGDGKPTRNHVHPDHADATDADGASDAETESDADTSAPSSGADSAGTADRLEVTLDDAPDDVRGDTIVAPPSIVNEGPGAKKPKPQPGPPQRPEMSLETPAPVLKEVPLTRPMAFARMAWLLAIALGTAVVLFALFSNSARRTALGELIAPLAEGEDDATIAALASLLFWTAIVSYIVVIIVEAILVAAMLRGRGGTRWAIIPIVVIANVLAAMAVQALIAIDERGMILTVLLIAQWLVAAIATTASLLPGAGDWFRAKREARANPTT